MTESPNPSIFPCLNYLGSSSRGSSQLLCLEDAPDAPGAPHSAAPRHPNQPRSTAGMDSGDFGVHCDPRVCWCLQKKPREVMTAKQPRGDLKSRGVTAGSGGWELLMRILLRNFQKGPRPQSWDGRGAGGCAQDLGVLRDPGECEQDLDVFRI